MNAVTTGQAGIIDILLGAAADIDAADARGSTALMFSLGKPDGLQALLSAGADTEHRDSRGFTALTGAAWAGRTDVVRRRLARDARQLPANAQHRALMWAALKVHAGFVKMLLDSGADPAMRDSAGATAFELAGQARRKRVSNC